MADKTPDEAEGGEATPSSGPRRSGLDRLRAARSGTATELPARDRQTDDAGEGARTSSGERTSGSTALLESERGRTAGEATREADTPSDADTAAGAERRGRRGRDAGDAGAGAGATGPGRFRRISGPAASSQATGPSRRQAVTALVLGLLIVGLLIPVVAMRHRIVGKTKEEKAVTTLIDKRVDALAAGRRFAITFFSPDYKTIDSYSDQVAAASTGSWQNDFNGKRGQLKSLLTQVQSQATGRVLTAGVSKVSGNDVEVLIVVDQDVKNTTSKGKTVTNRYRVQLSMQKTDKGWLVTNLEPVV